VGAYADFQGERSSNRTIVELKRAVESSARNLAVASNRTIVELKQQKEIILKQTEVTSNRTIVELKQVFLYQFITKGKLLIAPSWN